MPLPQLFRSLILTSEALAILGLILDALAPVSQDLQAAAQNATHGSSTAVIVALFLLLLLVGGLTAAVGLYLYKPWGRRYSFWITVIGLVCYPFLGPVVRSGWVNAVTETSMVLWGAVLAMAYYSDIRHKFEPPEETSP